MIRTLSVLCLGVVACALTFSAQAKDDKDTEHKLTGTITCAKCDLGVEKKCATVIVVKEKDEKKIYYFDKDSNKKYHGDTCKEAKEGTVTGTTGKDGDKMTVSVKTLEYKK